MNNGNDSNDDYDDICVCLYELLWLQMNMYYLQSGASGRSATIAFLLLRV